MNTCRIRLSVGRLILLMLAVLSGLSPMTQAQQAVFPRRVVFVCEHGSVKSLIAASYFNQAARRRGLQIDAIARGTAPERTVPRIVEEGLSQDGMNVKGYLPQLLRSTDLDGVFLVVSFDQDVAAVVGGRVPVRKWDNLPGVLADYSRGRIAIVRKVESLIEKLEKEGAR